MQDLKDLPQLHPTNPFMKYGRDYHFLITKMTLDSASILVPTTNRENVLKIDHKLYPDIAKLRILHNMHIIFNKLSTNNPSCNTSSIRNLQDMQMNLLCKSEWKHPVTKENNDNNLNGEI